jgi:hypothetical protein
MIRSVAGVMRRRTSAAAAMMPPAASRTKIASVAPAKKKTVSNVLERIRSALERQPKMPHAGSRRKLNASARRRNGASSRRKRSARRSEHGLIAEGMAHERMSP